MFRKLVLCRSSIVQLPQILQKHVVFYGKKPNPECQDFKLSEIYKPLTMDDMPVPYCSWQENHAKMNKKFNMVLLFGLITVIGSTIYAKEAVFYNACPPPYPFSEDTDESEDGKLD